MMQICYPSWDDPSPLNIQIRHDIPKSALKALTKYNGTERMAREHLEDVAALAILHGITHEDIMIRIPILFLEGRALQWYKMLDRKSICSWVELVGAIVNTFDSSQDAFQLLMHISTIQRASLESIMDFNVRFWRSWRRISEKLRPMPSQAHLYYVRYFHQDIGLLLLQSGEQRFPQVFQEAIKAEQLLFLSRKMQWRETTFPSLSSMVAALIYLAQYSQWQIPQTVQRLGMQLCGAQKVDLTHCQWKECAGVALVMSNMVTCFLQQMDQEGEWAIVPCLGTQKGCKNAPSLLLGFLHPFCVLGHGTQVFSQSPTSVPHKEVGLEEIAIVEFFLERPYCHIKEFEKHVPELLQLVDSLKWQLWIHPSPQSVRRRLPYGKSLCNIDH